MKGRWIAGLLVSVVLIYCALQVSWLLVGRFYEGAFRGVASLVFAVPGAGWEVTFVSREAAKTDTRAEIVNRRLMARDGSGPVRQMDFDIRSMGWNPTALFCALVLASPVSWGRRWRALVVGVVVLQVFVLVALGVSLWLESSHIGLVELSPFWQGIVGTLRQGLADSTHLAAPVLLWVVLILPGRWLARGVSPTCRAGEERVF